MRRLLTAFSLLLVSAFPAAAQRVSVRPAPTGGGAISGAAGVAPRSAPGAVRVAPELDLRLQALPALPAMGIRSLVDPSALPGAPAAVALPASALPLGAPALSPAVPVQEGWDARPSPAASFPAVLDRARGAAEGSATLAALSRTRREFDAPRRAGPALDPLAARRTLDRLFAGYGAGTQAAGSAGPGAADRLGPESPTPAPDAGATFRSAAPGASAPGLVVPVTDLNAALESLRRATLVDPAFTSWVARVAESPARVRAGIPVLVRREPELLRLLRLPEDAVAGSRTLTDGRDTLALWIVAAPGPGGVTSQFLDRALRAAEREALPSAPAGAIAGAAMARPPLSGLLPWTGASAGSLSRSVPVPSLLAPDLRRLAFWTAALASRVIVARYQ